MVDDAPGLPGDRRLVGDVEIVKFAPGGERERRRPDEADATAVVDALRRLARPVVLHTEGPSGLRAWLEKRHIGRAIFRSETEAFG